MLRKVVFVLIAVVLVLGALAAAGYRFERGGSGWPRFIAQSNDDVLEADRARQREIAPDAAASAPVDKPSTVAASASALASQTASTSAPTAQTASAVAPTAQTAVADKTGCLARFPRCESRRALHRGAHPHGLAARGSSAALEAARWRRLRLIRRRRWPRVHD